MNKHTGENIHVVSLASVEGCTAVFYGREWRPRSEKYPAIGVFHGFLEGAFGELDRVGKREDNRSWVECGHCLDNGGAERTLAM